MGKPSFKKGFTLVELLIVIAILGILAVGLIAIVNPAGQLQKAQDSKRKSDLSQVQKALETYYQDNRVYPDSINNKIGFNNQSINWGTSWAPYMTTLPKDPTSSKQYVYYVSSDRQTYYLYASLDRVTDSQACFSTGNPCSSATANSVGTACIGNCNYGISSQNVSP